MKKIYGTGNSEEKAYKAILERSNYIPFAKKLFDYENNFHVFIPARGGSKSIKDKNIQNIDLPLVERAPAGFKKDLIKKGLLFQVIQKKYLKLGKNILYLFI